RGEPSGAGARPPVPPCRGTRVRAPGHRGPGAGRGGARRRPGGGAHPARGVTPPVSGSGCSEDQSSASAPGGGVVTGAAAGATCASTGAWRESRRPRGESGSVTPNRPKLAPRPTVVANAVIVTAPAVASSLRRSTRLVLGLGRTCGRTEHPPPPYRPMRA